MNEEIINQLNNYTLLFVENEKGIRDNFKEYFELLFKDVYIACDGIEAYDSYKKYKPNLIITDIKMPNLDGINLVQKIRQIDTKTNIVIISAHTDIDFLLNSIPLNLIEYIVKPLNQTKLINIFTKFLDKQNNTISFKYDKDKSQTIFNNKTHILSLKENIFLNKLINEKRIITYEEIELDIWDGKQMSQNALRLFIKNLRKKLPSSYLKNISNYGYHIEI